MSLDFLVQDLNDEIPDNQAACGNLNPFPLFRIAPVRAGENLLNIKIFRLSMIVKKYTTLSFALIEVFPSGLTQFSMIYRRSQFMVPNKSYIVKNIPPKGMDFLNL